MGSMDAWLDPSVARSSPVRNRYVGRTARASDQSAALNGKNVAETARNQGSDFHTLVIPLMLVAMAYPSTVVVGSKWPTTVLFIAAAMLVPLIIGRLSRVKWPAIWLVVLVAAYAISNQFEDSRAQGFAHTATLVALGVTFLAFATYGADLLATKWGPLATLAVVVINLVTVLERGFPKNAAGGVFIYVCAIGFVLMLRRSNATGWIPALAFTAVGYTVASVSNFRFLFVASTVFFIAFVCANFLGKRLYWLVGLGLAVSIIYGVIWFFFNVDNRGFAWEIGQTIGALSGHRANSGRDFLWPYILYAIQENPIFGLGAGTLPRDIMNTGLSAHSYYIQLYLQMGAAGLTILVFFLLALWRMLTHTRTAAGRFGSAIFLMFIVHNATEVLLLQNNALVAVPAWCAIGLALAIDEERASEPIPEEPEITARGGDFNLERGPSIWPLTPHQRPAWAARASAVRSTAAQTGSVNIR